MMRNAIDPRHARDALHAIDPGCDRNAWHRVGRAAIAAGLTVEDIIEWSKPAANFSTERDVRAAFRGIKPNGGTGIGTLWDEAMAAGWRPPGTNGSASHRPREAPARPQARAKARAQGTSAAEVWNRCEPATAAHGYIRAKGAEGVPLDALRVVPEGDPLRIAGASVAGWLAVPMLPLAGGEAVSLQFIPPPGAGKKLNLSGHPVAGVFIVGELVRGEVAYIVEGIGQAWACWRATGRAAVVTFGAGRMRAVAEELRERDPSAKLVLVPDAGKEADALRIAVDVGALVATMPAGSPPNFDADDFARAEGADALEELLAEAKPAPEPELPFALVPIADLAHVEPPPPAYVWEGLVPVGHVTLLAAHGGIGKSLIALMLCIAVALGLPLFGIATRRGIAAFFSGEDGAKLLRYRLRLLCCAMGVRVQDLEGRLFILDATEHDPALFVEATVAGRREGTTTATYAALREFVAAKDVSFLVVDNASDAYDASEIDRARVRGFVRALARIARERDAGLLLLAHVDKGTSRGERDDTEGYSGSTAWNNSARARLFLSRDRSGALLLKQQKHQFGKLREPLALTWPEGGIPQVDVPFGPVVRGIAERGHERALLKLIAEFSARGEFVSTATTSRTHAAKLLRCESTFPPRLKDAEAFDLLRRAERAGHLERVQFKGTDRHQRERWQVTPAGAAFAGIVAATAGTAATSDVPAPAAVPAAPAATAATSPLGGTGGTAPHAEAAAPAAGGA